MTDHWQYQVRIYLSEAMADAARRGRDDPALATLSKVLQRHAASPVSQFDAFEAYLRAAEQAGPEDFPLYKWTKATLEDPAKRAKHIRVFALRVEGRELYSREIADALEADLQQLVAGGVVERITKHDSNPANNLAVPAEHR